MYWHIHSAFSPKSALPRCARDAFQHRLKAHLSVMSLLLPLVGCLGIGAPYPEGAHEQLVPGSTSHTVQAGGHTLRWVQAGRADATPVLFIHGTPGSWAAFSSYMTMPPLAKQFTLISVDRPGFGASTAGGLLPKLADQAEVIAQALFGREPAIVVGHSLGGPIAVQLAADYPQQVHALVLVAGSFDPALEAPRWYNMVADSWPLRYLVPGAMRSANAEVMVLADELDALRTRWADVRAPITVIQGGKDRLVYPENADFAEQMVASEQLTLQRMPEAGHFVLWEQPDVIAGAILAARR